MTNKEIYKQLCETEGCSIPLFLQYWWMETVCAGKAWDVALVFGDVQSKKFSLTPNEGATVVGAMPYLIGTRLGMRFVIQPQLTQYNGPWYNYRFMQESFEQRGGMGVCQENERLEFEKKVADKLMLHLSRLKLAYFDQHFSPSVTNWLPFHWWGYKQTTRYTYRINDLSDMDKVFANFDYHECQKKLLRLKDRFEVTLDMTPTAFADLHVRYLRHRNRKDIVPHSLIVGLCSEALRQGRGAIVALRPVGEEVIAAARFVVWDEEKASSLLSAFNPDTYTNVITDRLVWKCIAFVADKTKVYDFEGSMDMNIEKYYRHFGAVQTPFHRITKSDSRLFEILLRVKAARERRELTRRNKSRAKQHPKHKKHRSRK